MRSGGFLKDSVSDIAVYLAQRVLEDDGIYAVRRIEGKLPNGVAFNVVAALGDKPADSLNRWVDDCQQLGKMKVEKPS